LSQSNLRHDIRETLVKRRIVSVGICDDVGGG
jgi:hypothetical protein